MVSRLPLLFGPTSAHGVKLCNAEVKFKNDFSVWCVMANWTDKSWYSKS